MKRRETEQPRIAYVLRMYPRFSQTFIVNEILTLQEQGADVQIASLKRPTDGVFHDSIARIRGQVAYFPEFALSEFGRFRSAIGSCLRKRQTKFLRAIWLTLRHAGASWIDLLQAAYLLRWVKKNRIDHVHVHFGTNEATVAWLANQLGGLSYSMTLHAFDIFRETVDRRLLALKINQSRFTATVTEFNARFLRAIPGVISDRVRVAYNGIDLCRFAPDDGPRDPGLVFSVGRLIEKKGFIHLIRAVAKLRDEGRAVKCVIAGDGVERRRLEEEIRKLRLTDDVTLAGSMEQNEVAAMMRRATAFALPCVEARDGNVDALPTVLLESLAAGCPSVSTSVSGIPEIIEDGVSGLLVPPENPSALASALGQVLDDPQVARALASGGRAKATTKFDLATNAGVLRNWLHEAACRRTSAIGSAERAASAGDSQLPMELTTGASL
ncbi:MAG: glycosyltransferase [Phycisphaerales bacterium]|nr:glycosyltransferase [Phycisphaerales bacterium]